MAGRGLDYVIETACQVWNMEPHRDVRVPPVIISDSKPILIDALWTDYALRPSATNLAFMVQSVQESNVEQWKQRLSRYPIRAGLLVTESAYILLQYLDPSGKLEEREIDPESLAVELAEPRSKLFTPKALAEFRTGQLTLADLEESITERSLSFLLRQRAELDRAFQTAIQGVLEDIGLPQQQKRPQSYVSSRAEIAAHGIRVAIAFMAARILEDKGFFGSSRPTNDPYALLNRTVSRVNGFFKKALKESMPYLSDRVLQRLAANLGSRVSFALVDHKDVGLLYERAIKELPNDVDGANWTDLQRHYTPVAIAERMLELLPLERLRPEERVIFDPAAGSGSLLLAATSRLAGMPDIPEDVEARKYYLAQHVAGNDLDQYADLVTQLRYTLARESLGQGLPFPFPSHFSHENYEDLNKENLGIKPRVIVANPPFGKKGNTQQAATFIEKVFSWLEKDAQFAFILPQSFLTASTYGIPNVRRLLTENCRICEVWQFPEGAVGIDARQSVCIVIGTLGKSRIIVPTVARAIFSGAKISEVRDNSFLGATWITQLNSADDWASVTAPPISINVPTIPLENLFFVFNGVKPGYLSKTYPPVSQCLDGITCKRYWNLKWRDKNRLWIDPELVDDNERWIRYGSEFLEGSRLENAELFDKPKILVSRKVNRSSLEPLAVQLDTTGFCPNDSLFCVLPIGETARCNNGYNLNEIPEGWNDLNYEQQRLWLLGILASKIGNLLSLIGRSTRGLTRETLCKLQLPLKIDFRIIDITHQIIERDQNRVPIPKPDELRRQLDEIVEESYGNPHCIEIARTGEPPELKEWKSEQTKPTFVVRGQVLEVSKDNSQIHLYLSGLMDDNKEEWVPMLPEIPGWALDGTVFEAELSEDVATFEEIAQRPWAIRHFRHTPRPYFTDDELREELGMET
ncbi:hypothetical protein NIES4071_83700 [Calothrix sp. NIES-4071]|nr:hypothetical protein NIES4071_83700 [Calothrix sp. NIES-4071]BAZ62638.1 hypothetical protein NIES4105_83630 [Calothrix sp. NIES-4105]